MLPSLLRRSPGPLLLLTFTLLGLAGCGSGERVSGPAGKDGPSPAPARRQSEFDFYCSLRPSRTGNGPRPFAPAVYGAMKSNGYRVYLVRYRYERPADGFGSFGGIGGYGFRDFFGGPGIETATGGRTNSGQRVAVVWETRRGEFFMVDRYYATPLWLDGGTWLEKVRFYDPAAVSVEVEKS